MTKMPLNDLPAIRLPENGVFLTALSIVIFIFFFTKQKQADLME